MKPNPTLLILWHGALYPSYRMPFWQLQTRWGWTVHLLCASRWSQALPEPVSFVPHHDEPIHVHPGMAVGRFHGATFFFPSFPWWFHRIQPDLVYLIEEPFSLMGWWGAYWCQRHSPPVPYVLYTYQDLLKRYPVPFRWMEAYTLRHAEKILVPNATGGSVIEQKGALCPWDVLPASVNLDHFRYREPRVDSLFTIGYIGRLVPEKGLDTLLWALSDLGDHIRLRITGDGPDKNRLKKMVDELGIHHQVAFQPPCDHEQLLDHYRDLDAVVLPSRTTEAWQEQFGRVLIEAMACGVPVIGSDSGAIPEVIGPAGLIVPEGNSQALAEKIIRLVNDTDLRKRLSLIGRSRAEKRFSVERVAEQMHQHFSGVMESCSHAHSD